MEGPVTLLTGAALDTAILQLPTRPIRAIFQRATLLVYADDPLGRGRPIRRQRFNVEGGARVLYLGSDEMTCLHEIRAVGTWPKAAIAILPVEFELKSVVDLRRRDVLRILQTTEAEIGFNFRSRPPGSAPTATQLLGERCAAGRQIDALLYHSPAVPSSLFLRIAQLISGQGASPNDNLDLAVFESSLAHLGSWLQASDSGGNTHRLPDPSVGTVA